jgi:hypothetical protein
MRKIVQDEEEEDDYGNEEEESDIEEDEEDIVGSPGKKVALAPPKRKKSLWTVTRQPEIYRVIDKDLKKIIAEAGTIEELSLQLSLMAAQNAKEAAENTK